MDRAQKAQFVDEVRGAFSEAPFVILTDFKGSTVLQLDTLRRACESAGGSFRVVKNTLSRIAVTDTPMEGLAEHFRGNIGVVFAGEDPVAVAKVFREQVKENDKLVTKAGFFEGDVLDSKQVAAVADFASKEELLSKLLATIIEGPRQIMGVIQGPGRDLVYLLNNFASKLEDGE